MNFLMRSAAGTALAGSFAAYGGLLPLEDAGHPGPKFIRVNADGTSSEVAHVSSRFVKARVNEMAQTEPQSAEEADKGADTYLQEGAAEDPRTADMVRVLVAQGLPEPIARMLVKTNPEIVGEMMKLDQPAPAMGCRLKAGERVCM